MPFPYVDGPPDWDELAKLIPQSAAMKTCIQDPVFHAEGDVWTHTRMVVDALLADPALATLAPDRRRGLLLAAIFHDVAKPATREVAFDEALGRERVSHHGHAKMGARDAWLTLWKSGEPLATRLQVYALIAWHQKSFHVMSRSDPRTDLAAFSAIGTWRELLAHTRADNNGRLSPNVAETRETLDLLELTCEEHGVLDGEWPFGSDGARTLLCRGDANGLYFTPPQPAGSRVVVMSAPPGSGKDTYIERRLAGLPVISLDRVREELDVDATDNQGRVVQAAHEQAREYLRSKTPFVWNATGTSRMMRDKIIGLALQYDAQVAIHALDCPHELMLKRNRSREARVPDAAIERMLLKWEPPLQGEAHEVAWFDAVTYEPVLKPAARSRSGASSLA